MGFGPEDTTTVCFSPGVGEAAGSLRIGAHPVAVSMGWLVLGEPLNSAVVDLLAASLQG